ncbi:MAG: lysyl endopeptidase [bacterium]|nr:MAG: lysyl endopeptidase [bacterium]
MTLPSRVVDLAILNVWPDSVELQWTNAGDDDWSGTASSLVIRRSTSGPLTDVNFTAGVRLQPAVTPESGGSVQRTTFRGLTSGTQYWFALRHVDEAGNGALVSNCVSITAGGTLSGVPESPSPRWGLETPTPNPFVGSMVVGAMSPEAGEAVRISLLDAAGRQVRVLHDGFHPGGRLALGWDGHDDSGRVAPAGVYFLVMTNGRTTDVRKIVRAR